ncbi:MULTISPECIES: DUF6941 family protein [Enterococcus]|uniref:DUF6941 family protein n=1 Tax=Enterococcus TaxID=1350 RepID=UPI0001E19C2B|nr:hypothetical protein [Enterococcus faecalis]EFM71581.1 hypothetical protein HMPREF9505_00146 [Enterococcus faecalis TX0109]EGO8446100.1 hypothetical protein [Enterococcus faecalis]EGO8918029.1 hypothetical protein [Enterococcus faecalis]EGO9472052.1 hypothetical protein [Enterococcus faecalis]EHL2480118.1 hypothetical protein [Enterococcus faecalis]
MYVNIFFAEGMENQQQGFAQRLSVINPFVAMRAPFIPTALSFTVGIVINGIKPNTSYDFDISITNKETGQEAFKQTINSFSIPEENMDNLTINFDLKNVPFENEGEYECVFSIGSYAKSESLFIIKANQ